MERTIQFYEEYFSQKWYTNTFLVRSPHQIARVVDGAREWNNINDSGCNFVCLAMIVGMDPARLASILARRRYFYAEAGTVAKRLNGSTGRLIADDNAPNAARPIVSLGKCWVSLWRRPVTITLALVGIESNVEYEAARQLVTRARRDGLHVICGPSHHALLVAGQIGRDCYLWDPDASSRSLDRHLAGAYRLQQLFVKGEAIEFWLYRAEFVS